MKESTVVSFRSTEDIKKLVELVSKKNGQSKSEFLEAIILDTSMNFEALRHKDSIADFLDVVVLPNISQEQVEKIKQLQNTYYTQRLAPHMRIQKHLTNIAIRSYIQDYAETFDGTDGFIINQCLQSIYDVLANYGIITREEWEEKNQAYTLYMEEQKIIQQE
jgi:hypothetical protein